MAKMETRGEARIKLDAGASLKVNGDMEKHVHLLREEQKAEIVDVSALGIGVVSPVFLPKGAILNIQVNGAAFGMDTPIKIKGEVRYCKPEKGRKCKVGIKFIEIEDAVLNKIKEYVTKCERREAPRVKFQ